jgi:ribonuclease HI
MNLSTPHYLLLMKASRTSDSGRWRFSLHTPDGSERFAAADVEPQVRGERLDLLTVVRALEALDQPSEVTLIGCGQYVRHGMQYGLPEWRSNGWRWELFGEMVPVKNGDLWQRLDRALRFHRVQCQQWRFDRPHQALPCPKAVAEQRRAIWGVRVAARGWLKYAGSLIPAKWRQRLAVAVRLRRHTARSWTPPVSCLRAG